MTSNDAEARKQLQEEFQRAACLHFVIRAAEGNQVTGDSGSNRAPGGRHLIALGIHPGEVMKASRCRRGYSWMSGNGIVQRALNNAWLWEQGVPDLKAQWIELHYGSAQAPCRDIASANLTGTA